MAHEEGDELRTGHLREGELKGPRVGTREQTQKYHPGRQARLYTCQVINCVLSRYPVCLWHGRATSGGCKWGHGAMVAKYDAEIGTTFFLSWQRAQQASSALEGCSCRYSGRYLHDTDSTLVTFFHTCAPRLTVTLFAANCLCCVWGAPSCNHSPEINLERV